MLMHMGDANVTSSCPQRLAKILQRFPGLVVIASHLGGYSMWDESMAYLVGKNVYFDTSSSLAFLTPKKAANIIRAHGTDKVLFGSDYPMWLPGDELKRFMALALTDEENEKILYGNAAKLFGV
jgi:predicted TIM-barrel fold metal-dependent hydrolase